MDVRDDIRARLGANVRDLRVRRRLTQEALGERAGLSYKFIGEVERGLTNASVDSLTRIADALEADVADLFARGSRGTKPYDRSGRHFAVVREAQARLATAIKEWQNAALGRVPRRKRRRRKT
jgi:transcriptional regulator with XRE-family HTH domain